MDKRVKNLVLIVGVIVLAIAFFVYVLSGLSNPDSVSFEQGLKKMNAVVENNNVPIARFQAGELFSLTDEGTITNDFSETQFLKLKNDLRKYKETISANDKQLLEAADFYIQLIELNEDKKTIYNKIISVNRKEVDCELKSEFKLLLALEQEYEIESLEFILATADFVIENLELDGMDEFGLSFESDLSVDDVTVVQESVAVLEEFCG